MTQTDILIDGLEKQTHELELSQKKLQNFNDMLINREMKMIELKKENTRLREKLGQTV
jgi:hypothetical protein